MSKKKILLLTGVILSILWVISNYTQPTHKEESITKGPSGEMTTKSLTHLTLNDKPFIIEDYDNQNIIVSFYSSTCPYCKKQTDTFHFMKITPMAKSIYYL